MERSCQRGNENWSSATEKNNYDNSAQMEATEKKDEYRREGIGRRCGLGGRKLANLHQDDL